MTGVTTPPERTVRDRVIGNWLLVLAVMVFVMIVIGGLTRLTQSGLSMVEWRPITGWLPPLTDSQWQAAFEAYQRFPEYQKINSGMSLLEFKEIFWLEYIHRVWGRLIGVAFFLPFLFFLAKGWIERRLAWPLAILFVLGGLQGALGWYMVQSGLVDRPDVSQYRLVAHLAAALALYSALLWIAFRLRWPSLGEPQSTRRSPRILSLVICLLVFSTIVAGGFVAGINAGFIYNTFPLMNGEVIPDGLFALHPWYRNLFEDTTTVQFIHRLLALATLAAILGFRWSLSFGASTPSLRRAANWLCGGALLQVALGIATLVMVVPIPLASAHQAGAVILWSLTLWITFQLYSKPRVARAGQLRAATA